MKKLLYCFLAALLFANCETDDEQPTVCSCSTAYTQYVDSDSSGIYISNVFTPNGDGVNDEFFMYGYGFTQASMKIKDGDDEVFSTNNPNVGWDGTVNGNLSSECKNYQYIVDVTFTTGISKHFENSVTVLRYNGQSPCPDNFSNCVFGNQFDGSGFNPGFSSGENTGC